MSTRKSIEVDERTYARLSREAAARGMTVDQYVAQLAGVRPTLTPAEREARAREVEEYLREHFGFNPTPEKRAEYEAEHRAKVAALDAQAAARNARRASA